MKHTEVKANPFLTLAVAFISQVCAGTLYWFPSITPGIASSLKLTQSQSTVLIAVANTGSTLGIIGGLINQKYGSRITASISAILVSLSYFSLGLLTYLGVSSKEENTLAYALALIITTCIVTTSYPLYSCSIAATVSVFPLKYRGRIVGLNTITYGGAAGLLAAIQTVFFSSVDQACYNMFLLSFCASIVSIVTYIVYPPNFQYDVESIFVSNFNDEQLPLQQRDNSDNWSKHISSRLSIGYKIALSFLISLQISAVFDIIHVNIYLQVCSMIFILISLFAMIYLPLTSSLSIYPSSSTGSNVTDNNSSEPSLWEAMIDWRGLYIEIGCIVLVGGSGVFLLTQSLWLADAWRYGKYGLFESIPKDLVVRSIVMLFVAFSVTGRLILGNVLDKGNTIEERILWNFYLLRINFLIMMIAMLSLSIPNEIIVLLSIIGIGCSYGAFFCVAPTLTTLWFGVKTFPRNFAVYGGFGVIASLTLNSSIPAYIRSIFGDWFYITDVDNKQILVCGGISCVFPTVLPSAGLLLIMYFTGGLLERIVRKRVRSSHANQSSITL